jgi:hypothetical protein
MRGNGRALRRHVLTGALLSCAVLAVGCGSSSAPQQSQSFHPGASASAQPTATQTAGTSATTLTMPPFGHGAHAVMTGWQPSDATDAAAVLTAKDFVLAVLYADYTGGHSHGWQQYVGSPRVRAGLNSTLGVPSVTTESFTGTVRFWRMSMVASGKSRVEVTECVDTAKARNTSLHGGQVLPRSEQTPANQNFYSNTDVLTRSSAGQWRVVSIPATIYYPQAQECKP